MQFFRAQNIFILAMMLTAFSACRKDDIIAVPGNDAPADPTISNATIETYIIRSYISLLAREPDSIEFNTARIDLKNTNFSSSTRATFIEGIISKPAYKDNLYTLARADLLNSMDTNLIAQQIFLYSILLQDPAYILFYDLIQDEIDRLELMREIPFKLQNGTINIKEMFLRCVNNNFYDQLNMGSLNFVVSLWQHFLLRYPTQSELLSAIDMVDGKNAIVFLQFGKSKIDLINLFFNSDDYYEGQVRLSYKRFLFREPTSVEMSDLTSKYKQSGSYSQMQKTILISNEYAGL